MNTHSWDIVIGLEVHAQVTLASKLFSPCRIGRDGVANRHVHFVDAAMPGMLPILNKDAITQAVRTGLALDAEINLFSRFDRKHYFYADLPQGYQISQYHHPIVGRGALPFTADDGTEKSLAVTRLHLEQDAGKSIHDAHPSYSLIDLNRSGVTLMEIVFEPELHSAQDAGAAMRALRALLRAIGSCDGNMEEGNLRADVNVSVHRMGEPLGTRTETKNLNSIRFIQQAITFEANRQIELLTRGESVVQQTRLFDSKTGETYAMRSKEEAHDYRYFPDPDLPPLHISATWVADMKASLPELPHHRRTRFCREYHLTADQAALLADDPDIADYFEAVARNHDSLDVARWMVGDLFAFLNKNHLTIRECPVTQDDLSDLLDEIKNGTLSQRLAKEVFHELTQTPSHTVADIIKSQGMAQISDDDTLAAIISDVLAQHGDKVADYQGGKDKLFGFFVGQVMAATKGQANPQKVGNLLRDALQKPL